MGRFFQKVLSVGCLELICVVLALRMKVLPGLIIHCFRVC